MNCASRCAPRARGPLSRPVAMSLAREDYATMPRWRARARIVPFFSRERPVQTRKPSVTSGSGRGFCLAQARAQEVKKAAYASFSASNGTRSILLVLSPPPAKIPAARPRGRRLRPLGLVVPSERLWATLQPRSGGLRAPRTLEGRADRSSAPAGSCLSAMGGAAAPGACAAWAARARLWERASTPREDPAPPSTTAPAPLVRRVVLPTHRRR